MFPRKLLNFWIAELREESGLLFGLMTFVKPFCVTGTISRNGCIGNHKWDVPQNHLNVGIKDFEINLRGKRKSTQDLTHPYNAKAEGARLLLNDISAVKIIVEVMDSNKHYQNAGDFGFI